MIATRLRRIVSRGNLAWAAILPAVAGATLVISEPYPVRALRDLVFDAAQRLSPRPYDAATPVRIIAIDDDSLARNGQWPWPREQVAVLIERLRGVGAAAVGVDVLFSEPERASDAAGTSGGDSRLASVIADGGVVLGLALAERGAMPASQAAFATAGDDPLPFLPYFGGALLPLPSLREAAAGFGAMNWTPDRDHVVREVPTLFNVAGRIVPGLDVEVLRVAQGASTLVVRSSNASGEAALGRQTGVTQVKVGAISYPTSASGSIRPWFSGSHAERTIPAWKVMAGEVKPGSLDGAIALIGATATALSDIRATPLQAAVPGIEIRAEALESLIAGTLLTRPDYSRGLEALLVVAGCGLAVLAAAWLSPLMAAVGTGLLLGGLVFGSSFAMMRFGQLIDPVMPVGATLASFLLAGVAISRRSDLQRRQIREAFGRYVSPEVVKILAEDPSRLTLGGETRTLTVLFSDIRGFTARSESLDAHEVLRFLNEIHAPMTEHVLETGGTLDKFIGDGMMAFWNAPLDHPDPVRAALRCALKMRDTIEALDTRFRANAEVEGRPHTPVALGIGLHVGPASVGNVGSLRRFDYSAIGDTVNTAARIEPLCKPYGVPIIVSSEIIEAAPDFAYVMVDETNLRGQQRATRIYALHGDERAVTDDFRLFRDAHDAALMILKKDPRRALELLDRAAESPHAARYRKIHDLHRQTLAPETVSVSAA